MYQVKNLNKIQGCRVQIHVTIFCNLYLKTSFEEIREGLVNRITFIYILQLKMHILLFHTAHSVKSRQFKVIINKVFIFLV